MQEIDIHIAPLIVKFLDGTLNEDERMQLERWVRLSNAHREMFDQLQDADRVQALLRKYQAIDAEAAYSRWELRQKEPASGPFLVRWFTSYSWRAAASIILALGIGAYLWTAHKKNTEPAPTVVHVAGIQPGKQGAILTLADGTNVVLDSLGNGVVATQNGVQVLLKDDGLAYDPAGGASREVMYNAVSTPKGRQFHVTLPDGTQVWLNAASSIRYPTQFSGRARRVEITGEAYFQVAKNRGMPFTANVNNKMTVEVLGTQFNVDAYDNEETINTTLLEGSVKVLVVAASAHQTAVTLKPGQQAQVPGDQPAPRGIRLVDNVDTGKVMAWKNGLFNFSGIKLEEVMRQLERWYDIEVVYENGVPDIKLMGKMTRGVTLNELLTGLRELGLHYRLEGRKLIVLPTTGN